MKPTLYRNTQIRTFQAPLPLLPPGSVSILARVEIAVNGDCEIKDW